jgi:hypothetical protein
MTQAIPCPLCDTPKAPDARCPECGLTPEFGPERPNPFTGTAAWILFGAILGVFAVTLLVVGLTA